MKEIPLIHKIGFSSNWREIGMVPCDSAVFLQQVNPRKIGGILHDKSFRLL